MTVDGKPKTQYDRLFELVSADLRCKNPGWDEISLEIITNVTITAKLRALRTA